MVCGGLGLFMAEADPTRVACITGTKGKSTTTALAVHLLRGLGVDARAGGNIGLPPWDPAGGPAPDYWIIETSSFQVPDLQNAPSVVAVTSLSPDHLDWHGTVERYYADKLSLCTKPGVTLALADGADAELRRNVGAPRPPRALGRATTRCSGTPLVGSARPDRAAQRAQRLHGARRAGGPRDPGRVRRGRGWPRPRQGSTGCPAAAARSARSGTVEFVDDSLSTNVLPGPGRAAGLRRASRGPARRRARSRARLRAARPDDRRAYRHRRSSSPCPTTGRASERPYAHDTGGRVEVRDAADLDAAVDAAFAWAPAGGVVLLSPAAPSFGRFGDYRERSAAFAAAASRCGTLS